MNPFIVKRHDISKELKALVGATKDLPRGTFVSHDQIEELTGLKRRNYPYNALISKWKKTMLRERGVAIRAAHPNGTGYKLLVAREQLVDATDDLMKSAMKKVGQAVTFAGAIPDTELTDDQRVYREIRMDQFAEVKHTTRQHRALNASYLSNPQTLPRVKPKAIA